MTAVANNDALLCRSIDALAMAYLAVEEPAKACQPLRDAARIATSARQKEAVELLRNNLTCAP